MKAPIHSVKHYVQTTLTSVTTGTILNNQLITAVESTVANSANEVVEGAIVKAIYIELWGIGTTADQFYTFGIYKLGMGAGSPTVADWANLFAWDNKKNLFYTGQGLTGNDGISIPLPIFKGWVKIPKGKQRFGLGDKLQWGISSRGDATITICGFATYKEYT